MKTQEINKLFKEYLEKHKTIMTLDGVVDEKEENILFILKESNTDNRKDIGIKEFWFQNVFSVKSKNVNEYYEPKGMVLTGDYQKRQTQYYNCISKIKNEYDKKFGKDYGIFYININKEGGGAISHGIDIKEWLTCKEKRDFLIKQIRILAPEKVVVFSAPVVGSKIIDILHSADIPDANINKAAFHPSRYTDSQIEQFLEEVK